MNQEKIKKAKELMEDGWKAREDLDFDQAEQLLSEARTIFEEEGDWFNVTECLNHLAYMHRLIALRASLKGVEMAEASRKIAIDKKTKEVNTTRALMSTTGLAGEYERACKYAEGYLKIQESPAPRGDVEASLARFLLRTGKLDEAYKMIEKALSDLAEGWDEESFPHKAIWKSGALLTKALILYNMEDSGQARQLAREALEIAKEHKLKTRKLEAERFLDFLSE